MSQRLPDPSPAAPARRSPRCPICARAATVAEMPFCSPRCRDRDLLQWLGDGYALPVSDVDNALDSDGAGD